MSLSRYRNRYNHTFDDLTNDLFNFDMVQRNFFRPSLLSKNIFRSNLDMRFDMKENQREYIIYVDIPGVDKSDIQIAIQDDYLTISAERKSERENEEQDHSYYFSERSYGKVSRSVSIPKNVASESMTAKYDNGVLKIILPKTHENYNNTRYLNIE